jgi:membrane protein required for colicin V production
LTLFDGIVIAVLVISSGLAFLRGFTSEVLSILAWVIGALAALWLFPYGTPLFHDFISPDWLAAVASAVSIFILTYLVVAAFTRRWAGNLLDLFEQAEMLDRTLGLLFGAVRGLLIVTVAYLFFAWLVPNPADQPDWIRNAQLRPLVEKSAATLFTLAPSDSDMSPRRDRSPLIYREQSPKSAPSAAKPPASDTSGARSKSDADTDQAPSYNSSERKGLDRLFENAE